MSTGEDSADPRVSSASVNELAPEPTFYEILKAHNREIDAVIGRVQARGRDVIGDRSRDAERAGACYALGRLDSKFLGRWQSINQPGVDIGTCCTRMWSVAEG